MTGVDGRRLLHHPTPSTTPHATPCSTHSTMSSADLNGRPVDFRAARLPAVSNHRRPLLSPLWFLVALAAMLGLNASSAAAGGGLETRVRAFEHVAVYAVGQPSSERPASVGCVRPETAGMAVGSCVATNTVGALEEASTAAFRAADNIGDFSVSAKHLSGSGGNWNRFATGVDPNDSIAQALRSPSAQFLPNGEGTFKVVTNLGYQVGEKASQTGVRVIVTTDGRIITAFPVKP